VIEKILVPARPVNPTPRVGKSRKRSFERVLTSMTALLGLLVFAAVQTTTPEAGNDPASLKRRCEAGALELCYQLGLLYQEGEGVPKDQARAVALYQRACGKPVDSGCFVRGYAYDGGPGVVLRPRRAASLFKAACDAGLAAGCFDLGLMYVSGDGVPRDPAQVDALYRKACEGGVTRGCNYLAQSYENGSAGLPRDAEKAIGLFTKGCQELKDSASCYNLAGMYALGRGVPRDAARAAALFQAYCEESGSRAAGSAWIAACYQAALLYDTSLADTSRATALYKRACDGGGEGGCRLSEIREKRDRQRVLQVLEEACVAKDEDACGVLKRN
jgi:TPR repeat protein